MGLTKYREIKKPVFCRKSKRIRVSNKGPLPFDLHSDNKAKESRKPEKRRHDSPRFFML